MVIQNCHKLQVKIKHVSLRLVLYLWVPSTTICFPLSIYPSSLLSNTMCHAIVKKPCSHSPCARREPLYHWPHNGFSTTVASLGLTRFADSQYCISVESFFHLVDLCFFLFLLCKESYLDSNILFLIFKKNVYFVFKFVWTMH